MSEHGDQAASLRFRQQQAGGRFEIQSKKAVLCLSVASGKGGVGKTFFSVNLAVAFGRLNKRVLLVDADLGLANVEIVLGVNPQYTIQDAIFRGRPLAEVVARTDYGIDLLSASSGSKEMVNMGGARMTSFINALVSFASEYDVLIFDCAAGIDNNVTTFISATPQTVIIATPEPTSIMDVYALVKLIHQDNLSSNTALVVNMASSIEGGRKVAETLDIVSQRYLSRPMELLGIIPDSNKVEKAIHARKPLIAMYEDDPVSDEMRRIARSIIQKQAASTKLGNLDAGKLARGLLNLNVS